MIPVLEGRPTVVALKLAVVAPDGTVTVAGTESAEFVVVRSTVAPPGPAGPFRVTIPTEGAPP